MKKALILALTLSLIMPTPARAFFNRDCKNLAKRTASNQTRYEKQWNQYQNALGIWYNTENQLDSATPVLNRLRQVGETQLLIIDDLAKFRKCLTIQNPSYFTQLRQQVKKEMSEANWLSMKFGTFFPKVVNYTNFVKK